MTTFKGVMRSTGATIRRIDRANQSRNRELARAYKDQQKRQALANAAEEVEIYENYLSVLTSVHKDCSEVINWETFLNENPPVKPIAYNENEKIAQKRLENYKPSIIDKLFKTQKRSIERLARKVDEAKKKDEKKLEELLKEYKTSYDEWEKYYNLATGVTKDNPESYLEAIKEFEPFSDVNALGSTLHFNFFKDIVEITLKVNSSDVIPTDSKSLTSTGKLSVKKIPTGKFNELYQDYVCGCILRIAREMYALLPIKMAIINAVGEMINPKTGHLEETTIISIAIPQETLNKLRFESIDCSDAMKNFVCKMSFSKTNGFVGVEKLKKEQFEIV